MSVLFKDNSPVDELIVQALLKYGNPLVVFSYNNGNTKQVLYPCKDDATPHKLINLIRSLYFNPWYNISILILGYEQIEIDDYLLMLDRYIYDNKLYVPYIRAMLIH